MVALRPVKTSHFAQQDNARMLYPSALVEITKSGHLVVQIFKCYVQLKLKSIFLSCMGAVPVSNFCGGEGIDISHSNGARLTCLCPLRSGLAHHKASSCLLAGFAINYSKKNQCRRKPWIIKVQRQALPVPGEEAMISLPGPSHPQSIKLNLLSKSCVKQGSQLDILNTYALYELITSSVGT